MMQFEDHSPVFPELDGIEYYVIHPNAKTELGRLLAGESYGEFTLPNHVNDNDALGNWESFYEAANALENPAVSKWVNTYYDTLHLYAPISRSMENKLCEWMLCRIRELWHIETLLINTKRLPFVYVKKDMISHNGRLAYVQLPTHVFLAANLGKFRNMLRYRNGVQRPGVDHKMKKWVNTK